MTTLIGAYHVSHAALQALLADSGAVINLSAGAAHTLREGWSAYCSSKAGLAMLTRCVAHEYGAHVALACGLQPGLMDDAMQDRLRNSDINEVRRMPKEKLPPPDLSARLVAWLADTRPADLTGRGLTGNEAQLLRRTGLQS
jgi:NAD(P)-dependent dehydrogenase (short-subunit alcohol dehydrogenase family)